MQLRLTLIITSILLITSIFLASSMASLQLQLVNNVTISTKSPIDNVIIIMLENRSLNGTYGLIQDTSYSSNDPYIRGLISQYGLLAEYYDNGVRYGSINSYIAITNGDGNLVPSSTCNSMATGSCTIHSTNIADSLETANLSWKAYLESMTTPCGLTTSPDGQYDIGHNPFPYYSDIQTDTTRCKNHVVPAGPSCPHPSQTTSDIQTCDQTLLADLNSASPPNYMWLTPGGCNMMYVLCNANGDSCTRTDVDQATCIQQADDYLSVLIPAIMGTKTWSNGRTAIFLTWDEPGPWYTNDPVAGQCPNPNRNAPSGSEQCQIPGIWIGPMIKTGYVSHHVYTLYSFLKTIEGFWNLPAMTSNDAGARSMNEFFA